MQPPMTRCLTRWTGEFVLENDPELVPAVVAYLRQQTGILGLSKADADGLGVALEEAMVNSIHHGNLEVSSDLRNRDGEAFFDLIARRRNEAPYCQRRVSVRADFCPQEAVFVIRDEGPGFAVADLPDPRHPENIARIGGRGILLMRAYMDEVEYNERGNEVRLVKRRKAAR